MPLNYVSKVFRNRCNSSARNGSICSMCATNLSFYCSRCPSWKHYWGSFKRSDPSILRRRGDPFVPEGDLLRSSRRVSPRSPSISLSLTSPALGGDPHWSTELSGSLNAGSCKKNKSRALGGWIRKDCNWDHHPVVFHTLPIYSLKFQERCETYGSSQVESWTIQTRNFNLLRSGLWN